MKIYIDRETGSAYITHNDQAVRFNMALYREGRTSKALSQAKDYFLVLDKYFQTLDPHKQLAIWDFYVRCRQALDNELEISKMEQIIKEEINKIAEIFPVSEFRYWYAYKSKINIPSELKESIEDLPDPTLATEDQTYLRNDYIGLCSLSMAMTMLAPIFSSYVEKTKNDHGTGWKTYYAFQLIQDSGYYHCPDMQRLSRYIYVTLESMPVKFDSVILAGISKEEYPKWILAIVVTKKVASGDISGDPEVHPLIKYIYKYIQQKVQSMEKDFKGKVKYKNIENTSDSDNAVSQLENYKIRQPITDNLVGITEYYLEDPFNVAKKMDPDIPPDLIAESFKETGVLYDNSDLSDAQITLLKWVISLVVPSRIIDYVNRASVVNAIIAARAYLWYKEHYEIAALISAVPISNEEAHMATSWEKRNHDLGELKDKIEEYYPYYRKLSGAKKTKPQKTIYTAVEEIDKMLTQSDWYLTLPEIWLEMNKLNTRSRHYAVDEDIKLHLMKLAILIADRQKELQLNKR